MIVIIAKQKKTCCREEKNRAYGGRERTPPHVLIYLEYQGER